MIMDAGMSEEVAHALVTGFKAKDKEQYAKYVVIWAEYVIHVLQAADLMRDIYREAAFSEWNEKENRFYIKVKGQPH